MKEFIHLHVHSHYSLLDGLAKVDDLISKAKEYNMPALALTDHGVMYGAMEFYSKAKKAGIKPIVGVEVYIAPRTMLDKQPKIDTRPYHLVLLARDLIGYKNLLKLTTEAHLKGYYYKPRIDKETLKQYGAGLIALTSCLHGEIPRLLSAGKYDQAKEAALFYQSIFGPDGFYLELQYHPELEEQKKVNEKMKKLSKELNIPLVATNDIHYVNFEDRDAHELLLAIQTGKDIDDKERLSMTKTNLSMMSPEEIEKNFSDVPEAIANTAKIAEKCNLDIALGQIILPEFSVPKNKTPMEHLKDLCYQGLTKRYKETNKTIIDRLEYELSVIEKTGFADYFLIVSDFVNWAKNNGIVVGPGRGSAAGSIVSYCLNIIDLDPLKYDLLFERFLNPERISMPDIDIDFADDRRNEVIEYVRQKYGSDHVAQIITFGVMKARMAVRDAGRALGMTYQDVDKIAKLIPFGLDINKALQMSKDLKSLYENDLEVKKLIDMTKKLEGVARHASTHAAGIVISKETLTNYLPLQHSTRGNENEIITQYDMYSVDTIGLLKIDFLGLSNLTVIKNAIRIIRKTKGENINILDIPLNDKKTFNLLARAETTGVFQLESDGMKRYLKELKPTMIDDIIAMVALYRPGPMEFIPDYIAGKYGKKKITYLHPKLEPILKKTYGIALYQEQIMQIARDLAGFTMSEADVLRKAVGKKIKALLEKQKEKFVNGIIANNVEKKTAERIWHFVEPFARYGFNKSHAACYAMISYQTAYLKAHYPAEFMAALLTSDFHNLDRVAIEITECERIGNKVLPPDVNKSFVEFGVNKETNNITFSLAAIKNVGVGAAEAIVKEREKSGAYQTVEDFSTRLGPEVINKKTMESLARAGALDNLEERNKILFNMELILKFASSGQKQMAQGQIGLFDSGAKQSFANLKLAPAEPADKKQRLTWERELLGIYLSDHPLKEVAERLQAITTPIQSLSEENENKRVKVGGIITNIRKIITKNNEPMLFAKIEDTTAGTEIIVFPKTLRKNPLIWQPDNIVIVEGKLNNKDGALKILADNVKELGQQTSIEQKNILCLHIKETLDKEKLKELKIILENYPGSTPVMLKIYNEDEIQEVPIKIKVEIADKLLGDLQSIIKRNNIETMENII